MIPVYSYAARMICVVVAGVLYAMAYPPIGWGLLVVPGVGGLLFALRGQVGTRARTLGMVHGCVVYAVGLSWIWEIFGMVSLVLWCVLGVFHALFAEMLSRAERRGWSGWKFALFAAVNWGAWEFIRAELFPMKFPWMTVGLAMGPNALLPWVGVYAAGTLLVLAIALACVRAWRAAIGICSVLLVGHLMFRGISALDPEDPQAVKVGGVQLEGVTVDEYIKFTRMLPVDVAYVVWPEYAVPYDVRKNARDWKLMGDLCAERNITITFGTKEQEEQGWRNIALTMDAEGVRGIHNKIHTVHMFDDGIAGTKAGVVRTKQGEIGTPICFDCDYEGVVRRMVAAGAEFIVVPLMDAVSWSKRQHDQHAELMRIRAAENGRWMFVVGTSGVSMAIDSRGHVRARLAALEQGNLVSMVRRESAMTFYTKWGWLVSWFMFGVAVIWWVGLCIPERKGG